MTIVFSFPASNSVPERIFNDVNDRKSKKSNRTDIRLLNARIFDESFSRAYNKNALNFIANSRHPQLFNSENMYNYKGTALDSDEYSEEEIDLDSNVDY